MECNAEEGHIMEVEKEVDENDPLFKANAKISIDQARVNVLGIHRKSCIGRKRGWNGWNLHLRV